MIWENLKYATSLKSGEEEFLEGRVKRVEGWLQQADDGD